MSIPPSYNILNKYNNIIPNIIGSDGKLTPIPRFVLARFIDNGVIRPMKRNILSSRVIDTNTNSNTNGIKRNNRSPFTIAIVEIARYNPVRVYKINDLLSCIKPEADMGMI